MDKLLTKYFKKDTMTTEEIQTVVNFLTHDCMLEEVHAIVMLYSYGDCTHKDIVYKAVGIDEGMY